MIAKNYAIGHTIYGGNTWHRQRRRSFPNTSYRTIHRKYTIGCCGSSFFFLFFCIIVMSVAVVGTMHALLKQSIWGGNSSRRIFLIRTNILWECQQNKKTYNQGRWKWIEDSTRLFFFLIWFGFCWLVFCILSFVFIGRGRWPHIYYAPEGQHDGNCNRSKQFLPEWKQTATGFYGRMLVRNLLSINGITNITITSPWRPSTCCWNHDPRTNEIKQIEYSTVVCIYFPMFFFLFISILFVFVKKISSTIHILFQCSYISFCSVQFVQFSAIQLWRSRCMVWPLKGIPIDCAI